MASIFFSLNVHKVFFISLSPFFPLCVVVFIVVVVVVVATTPPLILRF